MLIRWQVVQGPRRCAFSHISAGKALQLAVVYRHLAARVKHWKPPTGPRQCAFAHFSREGTFGAQALGIKGETLEATRRHCHTRSSFRQGPRRC